MSACSLVIARGPPGFLSVASALHARVAACPSACRHSSVAPSFSKKEPSDVKVRKRSVSARQIDALKPPSRSAYEDCPHLTKVSRSDPPVVGYRPLDGRSGCPRTRGRWWTTPVLAAGGLLQRRKGRKSLRCRLSCTIYTVHPPAIFVRPAVFQNWPRPSKCPGNIAVFVDQPNATAAQRYGRLIDLFPGLIAWLPLPLPSLPYSFRNHRETLASAQRNFLAARPSCLNNCLF